MSRASTYSPKISPDFVARTLRIPILGNQLRSSQAFTAVVTDSRKIQPGCLFVALRGENFDAHDFITAAVVGGARGVLCRKSYHFESYKDLSVFAVDDTLAAYRRLASGWRREFSLPVIVVAGSVGKTTTKEILSAILTGKWQQVLKTQGSQNGYVGIPMTLLELKAEHGAAVIEVGIDEIGAMQKHLPVIAPTASVLTAIGAEHLEKLIDVPTVAREEGFALSYVAQTGGMIAVNLDDPWIRPHYNILRSVHKIGYTLKGFQPSQPGGELISGELDSDGKSVKLNGFGFRDEKIPMPLLGAHNASNLLGALAIARAIGLTNEEIHQGLKNFQGATGRSELRELPGSTPVVCDYYNANPTSVEAGLDLLSFVAKNAQGKSRWACLADMLELGKDEEKLHRQLAQKIIQLRIEHVLLLGPRMKALAEELRSKNFPGESLHFESHSDLSTKLLQGLRPGDAVLIKGSRGMKMEEVWKELEKSSH